MNLSSGDNKVSHTIPHKIQIEYEQLMEEIRTHNAQLLTLDTVFIPVFFGLITYGIIYGTTIETYLSILIIIWLIYIVFIYICCRATYIVESLRERTLQIEKEYSIEIHRLLYEKESKESNGLLKRIINKNGLLFTFGKKGPNIILVILTGLAMGIALYIFIGILRFVLN